MQRVVLVITGSIAATKCPDLIRGLREKGIGVTCVLTEGGQQFVSIEQCAEASGNKVYRALFGAGDTAMDHIRLSRENDLVVIVPASANFLAKMVHGFADDLATALLLASDKPVMVAPAMNVKMWQHPATQRNVRQLKKDGVAFCGPAKGALACGEEGEGRMVEPADIIHEIEKFLKGEGDRRAPKQSQALAGRKAVVTSGPTREGIDPVRYLSNYSSGKQGHAIAEALRDAGAEVTLVSGPTQMPDPEGITIIQVESAREMLDAVMASLPADIAVCTAAVADWTVAHFSEEKIKKSGDTKDFTLVFAENPDILTELGKHKKHRPKLVIGFAAESEHVVENARVKLERKGCDWILANDISGRKVFSSNENTVHLISKDTQEDWPKLSKGEVGERLVAKMAEFFAGDKQNKLRVTA